MNSDQSGNVINQLFRLVICSLIGATAIGAGSWMAQEIHMLAFPIPLVPAALVFHWIRYRFPQPSTEHAEVDL